MLLESLKNKKGAVIMSQNELVSELRSILENLPPNKLDEILSIVKAESAQSGGTKSPGSEHQQEV